MSSAERSSEPATPTSPGGTTDMKLEVVVIRVSDIDRAMVREQAREELPV